MLEVIVYVVAVIGVGYGMFCCGFHAGRGDMIIEMRERNEDFRHD